MLRISDITCERDDRILFKGLSYDFPAGHITQLEGRNGSGKTTLLRILSGLFTHYEGQVFWNDKAIAQHNLEFSHSLLYLGHKSAIKLNLTPVENLQFLIGLKQAITKDEIHHALEQVGLYGYENVLCRNLSAGQQRRVALASLYLSNATVLLLDEVFTAIDKQGVIELETFLSKKAASGATVILTTHHSLTIDNYSVLTLSDFALEEGLLDESAVD